MNYFRMILLFAVLGVAAWLLVRRARRAGRFAPAKPPRAPWPARLVEAAVLAAAAAVILAVAACWPSTGGYMLMLDQLQPVYATWNIVFFGVAVAGAALGIGAALLGRTLTGGIVLAVVLSGYGLTLNGGSYAGDWLLPESMTAPVADYALLATGPNIEGEELWVNGMCLGTSPYRTTLEEFYEKVPYWPEPPADYETDKLHKPRHDLWGGTVEYHRRWIKFEAPDPSEVRRRPGPAPEPPSRPQRKSYYARVRYAGEWAVAGGGSGGGSSGAGPRGVHIRTHFDILLPGRQKRLETLLDQARLADYRVGPEWFQAIETYDNDGWVALRQAADTELPMLGVLDDWARWRYGLDKAGDAEAAWAAFERIGEEARQRREYLTSSVAGRAVELLAPRLPRERLLDRAVELIRRSGGGLSVMTWRTNERLQFGFSERPGGSIGALTGYSMTHGGGWWGAPPFPGVGFPVAHAVWMLNEEIVRRGEASPNVIQRRIVPELVRWWGDRWQMQPMLAAAHFGGPEIDRFLLRQRWWATPEWEDRASLEGGAGASEGNEATGVAVAQRHGGE